MKYFHLEHLNECLRLNFKGQLQRFHKLSLFDRFGHVENGWISIFENSFSFSCYKLSKF